jgi:hypothetical protein
MQSVELNLVENDKPQDHKAENARPVSSAPAKEATGAKTHANKQAMPSEPMYAAFAWLFGSGCF